MDTGTLINKLKISECDETKDLAINNLASKLECSLLTADQLL